MKKPSGRKPRQQKQKRQRKAVGATLVHAPVATAGRRDETGVHGGASLSLAALGIAGQLSGFSTFYEGLMGTPPPRERAVRQGHGGGAGVRALSDADNQARDFMMLSLPILAMMMVGMVTQALKTERGGAEFGVPFPTVMAPAEPTVGSGLGRDHSDERVALAPTQDVPRSLVAPPVDLVSPVTPLEVLPAVGGVDAPPLVSAPSPVAGAVPIDVLGAVGPATVGSTQSTPNVGLSRRSGDVLADQGGQQMALLAPVAPPFAVARPEVAEPSFVPTQDVATRLPPEAGAGEQCVAPVGLLAGRGLRGRALAAPVSASLSGEAYGLALAAAAREQLAGLTIYNDKYRRIAYPMGDVQALYGVCTDVIIRAYRGVGVDLQQRVHEAGMSGGDASIGHRRTETLRRYLLRSGASLPLSSVAEDYQPGDIVTYYRPQNRHSRSHIAMVSDVVAPSGRYMILHNRGWGPQLEDGLFVDQMTGHYRYRPLDPARGLAAAATAEKSGAVPLPKVVTKVVSRVKSKPVAGRVRTIDGAATVGLGR